MLQSFVCLTVKHVQKPAPDWGPDEKRLVLVDECEFTRCFDPADVKIVQDWFPDELADTPRPGHCRVYDCDDDTYVVKLSPAAMMRIVNQAKKDGLRLDIIARQQ